MDRVMPNMNMTGFNITLPIEWHRNDYWWRTGTNPLLVLFRDAKIKPSSIGPCEQTQLASHYQYSVNFIRLKVRLNVV